MGERGHGGFGLQVAFQRLDRLKAGLQLSSAGIPDGQRPNWQWVPHFAILRDPEFVRKGKRNTH